MAKLRWGGATLLLLVVLGSGASAQQIPGCTSTALSNPPRTAYRCTGGLIIEAEASAAFDSRGPRSGGAISSIALTYRGLLIEVTRRRRFQILTPHAIASVRGTLFAVDVTAERTSVFVARGRTRVASRSRSGAVELGSGDGVDVTPGEPLVVRRWPAERAAALLGRFGRAGSPR
jgi:hypothetical protein